MISALALTRRFGARVAVDAVTFTVNRSEIVALLGPNGAGKTTTLRMLAGLIAPTRGSVVIDQVRMTRRTAGMLRARIGFLTEMPGLWDRLSVRENLQVFAALYPLNRPNDAVDRALDTFDLADRASTRTAELSKGMRQKVALARALLHDPAVLLLDEPMSGLDPEITRTVRTLLEDRRAAGCAILVSTHNLDEAERMADRVAVLDGKLLAIDRPAALRQRLTTGRVVVRVASNAAPFVGTARTLAPDAKADDSTLILTLPQPERDTPVLVRALVAAGADVLEVRPEIPALEDVYLHLLGGD
ncbi:MAG: multidrug ABC transporter ATP-binding protein [Blastocatellia bacterium]|nr:MAG: multidrug ABC transporter ATP-binding protein [Blastocatellia bacterium]